MKLAAIDIGSNSVHMIIVQASSAHSFEVIDREKEMIKLGAGAFRSGHLTEEAFGAGLQSLRKYKKLAERHGVDEIIAVATSAVREAENGGDFLDAVAGATGIVPRVISGDEEARLIYLAVRSAIDLSQRKALIIDVGGGSVEAIVGDARWMILSQSLKIGVQRLKDLFATEEPLSKRARREIELFVRARSEPAFARFKGTAYDCVVGSSGTVLSLGTAVNLRRGRTPWKSPNGQIMRLEDLRELANHIAEMTPEDRARVPGIDEERVDTIHIGALLLTSLLEQARVDGLVLCDSALREGLVIDYLERAQEDIRAREAVPDIRRRSVLELSRRSGQAGPHADKVAMLALQIFDQTQNLHQLSHLERRLLEYGALLHDIGQHIRFDRHEHHSYYLIHNGELRGFTEEEIEMIALLARYHRKGRPKQRHREYSELKPKEQRIVSILSGMLRVADGLDRSHFQVVSSVSCDQNPSRLTIIVHADGDAELELWAARRKSSLLARALDLRVEVVLEESRVATPTLS